MAPDERAAPPIRAARRTSPPPDAATITAAAITFRMALSYQPGRALSRSGTAFRGMMIGNAMATRRGPSVWGRRCAAAALAAMVAWPLELAGTAAPCRGCCPGTPRRRPRGQRRQMDAVLGDLFPGVTIQPLPGIGRRPEGLNLVRSPRPSRYRGNRVALQTLRDRECAGIRGATCGDNLPGTRAEGARLSRPARQPDAHPTCRGYPPVRRSRSDNGRVRQQRPSLPGRAPPWARRGSQRPARVPGNVDCPGRERRRAGPRRAQAAGGRGSRRALRHHS